MARSQLAGSARNRSLGPRVVSVVNAKGGVGKTTLANNLAIYLRRAVPQTPVVVMGLDDQAGHDAMFSFDGPPPSGTSSSALRRGCFDSVIHPGRHGVHYVPSSPRAGELERAVGDPFVLKRALERTAFPGVVFIDTKSDLEMLTQNAVAASDLTLVPVSDQASLLSAGRVFDLLRDWNRPLAHARILLTMIDHRIKYGSGDLHSLLAGTARRLGLPLLQTFLSRSPKVQALATNPEGSTRPILEAGSTVVHRQMTLLTLDLIDALSHEPADVQEPVQPKTLRAALDSEQFVWLRALTPEATMAVARDGQKAMRMRSFPFFIGRRDRHVLNDLPIPDQRPWRVSRRHAHLVKRNGRIGVMDLGSTLGTWVDDRQLGGPTGDPGPAFFGPRGGVLVLGKRTSPYAFDVAISSTPVAPPLRERPAVSPLRAASLAALSH